MLDLRIFGQVISTQQQSLDELRDSLFEEFKRKKPLPTLEYKRYELSRLVNPDYKIEYNRELELQDNETLVELNESVSNTRTIDFEDLTPLTSDIQELFSYENAVTSDIRDSIIAKYDLETGEEFKLGVEQTENVVGTVEEDTETYLSDNEIEDLGQESEEEIIEDFDNNDEDEQAVIEDDDSSFDDFEDFEDFDIETEDTDEIVEDIDEVVEEPIEDEDFVDFEDFDTESEEDEVIEEPIEDDSSDFEDFDIELEEVQEEEGSDDDFDSFNDFDVGDEEESEFVEESVVEEFNDTAFEDDTNDFGVEFIEKEKREKVVKTPITPSQVPKTVPKFTQEVVDRSSEPTDIKEFLRKHPHCEYNFALKYFTKKQINDAIKRGKIIKKGNTLRV
jgi:hypothetical protein